MLEMKNRYSEFGQAMIQKYCDMSQYYDTVALLFPEEAREAAETLPENNTYITNLYQMEYLKEENILYQKNITFLTNLFQKTVQKNLLPTLEVQVEAAVKEQLPQMEQTLIKQITNQVISNVSNRETIEQKQQWLTQWIDNGDYSRYFNQNQRNELVQKLVNITNSSTWHQRDQHTRNYQQNTNVKVEGSIYQNLQPKITAVKEQVWLQNHYNTSYAKNQNITYGNNQTINPVSVENHPVQFQYVQEKKEEPEATTEIREYIREIIGETVEKQKTHTRILSQSQHWHQVESRVIERIEKELTKKESVFSKSKETWEYTQVYRELIREKQRYIQQQQVKGNVYFVENMEKLNQWNNQFLIKNAPTTVLQFAKNTQVQNEIRQIQNQTQQINHRDVQIDGPSYQNTTYLNQSKEYRPVSMSYETIQPVTQEFLEEQHVHQHENGRPAPGISETNISNFIDKYITNNSQQVTSLYEKTVPLTQQFLEEHHHRNLETTNQQIQNVYQNVAKNLYQDVAENLYHTANQHVSQVIQHRTAPQELSYEVFQPVTQEFLAEQHVHQHSSEKQAQKIAENNISNFIEKYITNNSQQITRLYEEKVPLTQQFLEEHHHRNQENVRQQIQNVYQSMAKNLYQNVAENTYQTANQTVNQVIQQRITPQNLSYENTNVFNETTMLPSQQIVQNHSYNVNQNIKQLFHPMAVQPQAAASIFQQSNITNPVKVETKPMTMVQSPVLVTEKESDVTLVYEQPQRVEATEGERKNTQEIESVQKEIQKHVELIKETKNVVREINEKYQEWKEITENPPTQEIVTSGTGRRMIQEEVQKTLQRQMDVSINQIAGRVYNRLEEKLKSERDRRGLR